MTVPAHVCVVGSLHFDIMVQAPYLPRTGETLIGESWWWKPGGKGGNQAMAAARHGAATAMIGSLGSDEFGQRLRENLRAAGVDVDHVRTVMQGSGMSVAIQEDQGDYAAVVVSGANRELDGVSIAENADAVRDSRVLVLQNEISEAANVAAARIAREAGSTVVLNAAPARPLGALVGLVDILVVNEIEAEQLGAAAVTDLDAALLAARTLQGSAPTAVVTAGAAGVAVASGSHAWTVAAHEVANAETHGAGDVFAGALAARLAQAEALEAATRYANAAAALHVSTPEADRERLGPDDVRRLLSGGKSG